MDRHGRAVTGPPVVVGAHVLQQAVDVVPTGPGVGVALAVGAEAGPLDLAGPQRVVRRVDGHRGGPGLEALLRERDGDLGEVAGLVGQLGGRVVEVDHPVDQRRAVGADGLDVRAVDVEAVLLRRVNGELVREQRVGVHLDEGRLGEAGGLEHRSRRSGDPVVTRCEVGLADVDLVLRHERTVGVDQLVATLAQLDQAERDGALEGADHGLVVETAELGVEAGEVGVRATGARLHRSGATVVEERLPQLLATLTGEGLPVLAGVLVGVLTRADGERRDDVVDVLAVVRAVSVGVVDHVNAPGLRGPVVHGRPAHVDGDVTAAATILGLVGVAQVGLALSLGEAVGRRVRLRVALPLEVALRSVLVTTQHERGHHVLLGVPGAVVHRGAGCGVGDLDVVALPVLADLELAVA